MTLRAHPLNHDLITLNNETAISRSIRNLVSTNLGERFFNYNLGSRISSLLFENLDTFTAQSLQSEIELLLNNYEPRIRLISVNVNPNYDVASFDVIVIYEIIGIDVPAQQLSFALYSTR